MSGRVSVVGAGIGGLTAAALLSARGLAVDVWERGAAPGGKMREISVLGARIDSGPTVLTMRDVFEEVFGEAGGALGDEVRILPLDVLARHAWTGGATLDLYPDVGASADAIGSFAGAREAAGYRDFCRRAEAIYDTLRDTFIRAERPGVPELVRRVGLGGLGSLAGISPFLSMWRALGQHFADRRLRQLFGRYATYCGSSPFEAPATLMLVAHVERQGVWAVEGGMHRLCQALVRVAERNGARFHLGREVSSVQVKGGRASGVTLADGEVVEADVVVAAGDAAALGAGLLGAAVRDAANPRPPLERSLSALTISAVVRPSGRSLVHHNVFFSDDYPAEFAALAAGRLPDDPTVYICASDRPGPGAGPLGPERLFLIVNAPADSDRRRHHPEETSSCVRRISTRLKRCGLSLEFTPGSTVVTTPSDFAALFPGTGGALYGPPSHGWTASFRRPGARSRVPGLYLAGGSTHPGPGVPMAAISGRLAAASVLSDLVSTSRSRRAATPGGTSTRSATTAATASR